MLTKRFDACSLKKDSLVKESETLDKGRPARYSGLTDLEQVSGR